MPSEDDKNDVLSSLPRTRPQRRSARRDSARKPAAAKTANGAPAKEPAASAAAKRPATAKKPATARKPRAAAGGAAKKPRATSSPRAASSSRPRVEAVRPKIPAAGFAPPKDSQERGAPSGTELVGTAIQAAGELVQIGAAIGGQALKSALGRLGRG